MLRMNEKESMVEMVAFALDGPYPDGKPGDDFGVASISLRKLLRSGADHALGPIEFVSVLDGKMIGQLTCAVTAVQALSAIEAERGGRDRAASRNRAGTVLECARNRATSVGLSITKTINSRICRPSSDLCRSSYYARRRFEWYPIAVP